jgi:hypothetical protein
MGICGVPNSHLLPSFWLDECIEKPCLATILPTLADIRQGMVPPKPYVYFVNYRKPEGL